MFVLLFNGVLRDFNVETFHSNLRGLTILLKSDFNQNFAPLLCGTNWEKVGSNFCCL